MASLSFDRVGKTYGDGTVAVSNVSIDLADGEFLVLVGPSGCGKSTLLRMAAGLEALNSGRFIVDGRDVSAADPRDRDIAMVFQNYALYPHMTVRENISFGLEQRKVPRGEIERLVREVAQMLDLTPYLARKPGALSGGQRQRVAMGRAIVRHPKAFLMDEPLSNLDAKLRVAMRGELKLLNRRLGVTTLYVTHDQVEAMTMGDRVAVLKPVKSNSESNLQQVASPQELYDRPANLFVAGFIGSPAMNFLRARLKPRPNGLSAQIAGTDIAFPVAEIASLRPYLNTTIILGLRPEAFMVAGPDRAAAHVEVLVQEALGADTYVYFDLPSPPVSIAEQDPDVALIGSPKVNRIAARVLPHQAPKPGERLAITIDPERAHWFDPVTGIALR